MDDESTPLDSGLADQGLNPAELERWNIEDLNAYKSKLLAEVSRVEAVISGKSSVQDMAKNLFKS
jgi:uncharacterized small protein (DUF1192 family)